MFEIFLSWRHLLYQRDVVSFKQDPSCKNQEQYVYKDLYNLGFTYTDAKATLLPLGS